MRVIAGSAKGRRLKAVRGMAVRPTADRVKEGLFSILLSRFELADTVVLDLFAGTGGLGIEALSRGAARVVFVERDPAVRRVLQANASACGFTRQTEIASIPVRRALREMAKNSRQFDGVLIDPPYGGGVLADTLHRLGGAGVLKPGAWVMVERHVDDSLADAYGPLRLTETRRYGKTGLALFAADDISERATA